MASQPRKKGKKKTTHSSAVVVLLQYLERKKKKKLKKKRIPLMEIQKGHHTFVVFVICFHLFSLYIITVFFQRKPKKRTEKPSAKHQKKEKMKKKKKSHNCRDPLIVTPKAKNGFSSLTHQVIIYHFIHNIHSFFFLQGQ